MSIEQFSELFLTNNRYLVLNSLIYGDCCCHVGFNEVLRGHLAKNKSLNIVTEIREAKPGQMTLLFWLSNAGSSQSDSNTPKTEFL
jgi:hypothetical protein